MNDLAVSLSEIDSLKRDFINSMYGTISGLLIHDIRNSALQRPLRNFEQSFIKLKELLGSRPIELKIQEKSIQLCGDRLQSHFSTVEAQRLVTECFELSTLESVTFEAEMTMEEAGQFFSRIALQKSVGGKPRPIAADFKHIKLQWIDPEKLQKRLKSRELLMSPSYALQRYFLLKKSTEEFFRGIAANELRSQKNLKRDLIELLEIGRVAPYNLVALSLIHSDSTSTVMMGALSQALSTSLLSMVISQELEFSFRDQVNIGLVGLLYNVGLISEETNVILKNEKLTPVEYKRVLDAQAAGVYKLIRMQGSSRPVLERLLAIFEHSKGPEVNSMSLTLESRLLRLVSQYIALTSDRPFRDAYTPAEAIKILGSKAAAHTSGGDLDPILYYILVRFIGFYPVGSLVLLSDNRKAVVFRPYGEQVGRPLIKLCPQSGGSEHPELLDMAFEPELEIVKALDPKREGVQVEGYFFQAY